MALTRIKFCGLTRAEDADACIEAGAWAIGFIFWPGSPRVADRGIAAGIVARHRRAARFVGVFVDQTIDEVARTVDEVGIDLVQLHGSEGPSYCSEITRRTGAQVIKAARVRDKGDVLALEAFRIDVDFHLLDAYVPGEPGGTGQTFEHTLANAHSGRTPLILSGGLTPENVGDAIREVHPFAVDVSSGIETSPGIKDPALIAAFAAAVRATAPNTEEPSGSTPEHTLNAADPTAIEPPNTIEDERHVVDPNEGVEPIEPTLATDGGSEPTASENNPTTGDASPVDASTDATGVTDAAEATEAITVDGEILAGADVVPELLDEEELPADTTFVPALPGDKFDELDEQDPLEEGGEAGEFSFDQADAELGAEIDEEIDAELEHEESLDLRSTGNGGGTWSTGGSEEIVASGGWSEVASGDDSGLDELEDGDDLILPTAPSASAGGDDDSDSSDRSESSDRNYSRGPSASGDRGDRGGYQGNRDGGGREDRPRGGYQGNRDRNEGGGYQGNRGGGDRPGGYQGNRDGGERSGGYQGNRGGGYQGNRGGGDRPGGYQGNRDGGAPRSGGYQGNRGGGDHGGRDRNEGGGYRVNRESAERP